MKKTKLGRPKKDASGKRKKFMILLSSEERDRLEEAARVVGAELSTWIRMIALAAARKVVG